MPDEEESLLGAFGAGDDMAEEESEVTESGPEERAVTEFFEAGNSGDMAAATEAFKRAYRLCAASKDVPAPATEEAEEEY